jgi:hypothetical protein
MDAAKLYEQEFKDGYDVLWSEKESGALSLDEMRLKLIDLETALGSKYPLYKEVVMPKSGKQWKELIMASECPLVVAIAAESGELTLFKMDADY